jgi:hypothetical protein
MVRKDKAIVQESIDSIDAMARKGLERTSDPNGHGEPRILERACYLGILAMKSGWEDVVANLKAKIATFEQAYFKKYLENARVAPEDFDPHDHAVIGLPQANELRRELENWAASFDHEKFNGVRILGDAEDMMYELIDESDIRQFVHEIWL